MDVRSPRRIEHLARLFVQELGVFGVCDEPAKLRREGLDEADVINKTIEELRFRHSVVARVGGMRDEIAAFQALLQRARMAAGRSAGADHHGEKQQGGQCTHAGERDVT